MDSREIVVEVGGIGGGAERIARCARTSAQSVASLAALQERHARFSSVLALHGQLLGEASPMPLLAARITALESMLAAARATPRSDLDVRALGMMVDVLERAVLDADAAVRPAALRRGLADARLSDSVIVDYLTLIGSRAGANVGQRDRFVALASRLLLVTNDSGESALLSRAEADVFLTRIASGREVKASLRDSVLAFFHETVRKAHGHSSFADAIDEGMLIDVIGFKLTIGAEIVDPAILYGLVALEHEMWRTLEELCVLEGRPRGEPRWLAWKIALKMRQTFRRTKLDEKPEAQRFDEIDWRRYKWRRGLGKLKAAELGFEPRFRRATVLLAGLLGLIALWEFAVAQPASLHVNTLGPIPFAVVLTLSPMLDEGAFSSGDPVVFVGRVNVERWSAATSGERAVAAAHIATELERRGVRAALVHAGDVPAIQVESGVVVRVTDPKAGS